MKNKKIITVTIADPVEKFAVYHETTFCILEEATRRRYQNFIGEPSDLFLKDGEVFFHSKSIEVVWKKDRFVYKLGKETLLNLSGVDAIFVRKDPPIDRDYIDHLEILSVLEQKVILQNKKKPVFVNSPHGVMSAPEKILPQLFDSIQPPTLIGAHKEELVSFLNRHKTCIAKPLHLSGGRGLFMLKSSDINSVGILELMTASFKTNIVLQKYNPDVKKGDKRVLLFDGQILGAFIRVPKAGSFKANLRSGGTKMPYKLNSSDLKLIRHILPTLRKLGLHFVGLDIIGNTITEINVTSPMAIKEINSLYGTQVERRFFDLLEKKFL